MYISELYLQKWGWKNWWWYNRRRVTANDGNNFISHNFKAGMEPHNNIVGKDSGRALEKYEEFFVCCMNQCHRGFGV